MKVLALGAHFDDVELGCGGALIRHRTLGDEITIGVVTNSEYSNAQGNIVRSKEVALIEGTRSAKALGARLVSLNFKCLDLKANDALNSSLLQNFGSMHFDRIYTHWIDDSHPDHTVVGHASIHCFKRSPQILMYQSNIYQGRSVFHPNVLISIDSFFAEKIELIKIFKSENDRTNGRWIDQQESNAIYFGQRAECKYAEAFMSLRFVEGVTL